MRHLRCRYFPEPMAQDCLLARRRYFDDLPDPKLLPYTAIACECCPAGSQRERDAAAKRGNRCENCGVEVSVGTVSACNRCVRARSPHRLHPTDKCQFCRTSLGHHNKDKVCAACQDDFKRLKKLGLYISPEELKIRQ